MKKNLIHFSTALVLALCSALFGADTTAPTDNSVIIDRGVPKQCDKCGSCTQPKQGGDPHICFCFDKIVFQEADIRSIFALLADTSKLNIVVDPELSLKVTLKLENVTWCQFFSLLLDLYGLRAVQKEGYTYILAADKYWSLKFAEIDNKTKEKTLKETETRIFRIVNVQATNIQPAVQTLISPSGNIVLDQASNTFVIEEIPENFQAISDLIDSLDVLGRQVKVTCQIIQIDQSSVDELGIDWTASNLNGDIGLSSNMDNVGGAGARGSLGNFTWDVISGAYQFQTKLSAIISAGRGKILDQPYVITMDNISATIFSGKQIPINSIGPDGNIVTTMYSVGTNVQVTPRITKDDGITLALKVERSGYFSGASGFEITTRSVNTTMNVKSGEVVVIGGLVTNEKTENEYGVPLLKDLPLLGRLFTFTSEKVSSSVITLFITPEIQ